MSSKNAKYDTGVNIIGSIPDYADMIRYIVSLESDEKDINFSFRTSESTRRFRFAIGAYIMKFKNDAHKSLFMKAMSNSELSLQEKFIIIFWQLTCSDLLFRRITEDVFMKAVYQGRSTIQGEEILAYLHYIKQTEPKDLDWSESTLKVVSGKYLTLLKKLGLAEGTIKKQIRHPLITDELFVWFIRWCQLVCPEDRTLHNPYIRFSFMDEETIIRRLKKIENIKYWNISQIGNDITIDLKEYE